MEIKHRVQLPELLKHFELPLTGIECGCAEGFNAKDLLQNGIEKLFMVDAWERLNVSGDGGNEQEWHDKNYNEAMERVSPFKDKVTVLRGLTTEMAREIPDNSVGFVYLDAGHDYNSVMNDLINYFPKLVEGGVMAGHDFINPAYGVKEAVEEFCKGKYTVHVIPENQDEDAGFWFQKI